MQKSNVAGHAGIASGKGKSTFPGMGNVIILGKCYRGATDWIKPVIDKIIDPIAVLIGGNVILSIVIYYVNQEMLQSVFWALFDGKAYRFVEKYGPIEYIIKSVTYSFLYGLANIAVIIPAAVRLFRRTSVPTWKNHLKSWMIVALAVAIWNWGGVRNDVDQIRGRIETADGFFETVGAVFNLTNIKTVDRYMSGAKSTQLATQTWQVFGFSSNTSVAEEIQRECMRIRENNIATADDIARDAESLIREGLIDHPAQLIYLTRVVYFEGAYDPKAGSLEDIKAGLSGISSVMYNRYLFDTEREKEGRPRAFSKRGANLFDIVFHYAPNRHGGVTWQFSAIPENVSYFNGNQPLELASGKMNADRTLLCYDVLMGVLTGKRSDNTKSALFYQNPRYVDRYNRNWKERGLDEVAEINSHVFFRPSNLERNWHDHISG